MDLDKLEETLVARGLSPNVRKAIRIAKICGNSTFVANSYSSEATSSG